MKHCFRKLPIDSAEKHIVDPDRGEVISNNFGIPLGAVIVNTNSLKSRPVGRAVRGDTSRRQKAARTTWPA